MRIVVFASVARMRAEDGDGFENALFFATRGAKAHASTPQKATFIHSQMV